METNVTSLVDKESLLEYIELKCKIAGLINEYIVKISPYSISYLLKSSADDLLGTLYLPERKKEE